MLNTKMLAIIAGIAVVAATVTAYALIGVSGNGNGSVTVNENKGKGTVDTLEFKNPVTIKLLDPNGNVVGEKTVYNAITPDGKTAIYDALSDGSIDEIDTIAFVDIVGNVVTDNQLKDDQNPPIAIDLGDGDENATCTISTNLVLVCNATFTLATPYANTTGTNRTLSLNTNTNAIILGVEDTPPTPYFKFTNISITVPNNVTVSSIAINWQITVT